MQFPNKKPEERGQLVCVCVRVCVLGDTENYST